MSVTRVYMITQIGPVSIWEEKISYSIDETETVT